MKSTSQVADKNPKRPPRFRLSDAPIHRIQTLVASLSHAIRSLPGFENTPNATFIRRDFDFDAPHDHSPTLFNATHCYNGCLKKDSFLTPPVFTSDQIRDLVKAGMNSIHSPREALEKALRRLTCNEPIPDEEKVHHLLEIYSRVSYDGGLPGYFSNFLTERYNKENALPPLVSLLKVNNPKYKKYFCQFLLPFESEERLQPELLPLHLSIKSSYKQLQIYFEIGVEPTESQFEKREFNLVVIPLYDYLHSKSSIIGETQPPIAFGTNLGLLVIPIAKDLQLKNECLLKLLNQLIPHLNAFAADFHDNEFGEILREDYRGEDPIKFLIKSIPRIDSWKVAEDKGRYLSPLIVIDEGISIDLREDLFTDDTRTQIKINPSKDDPWMRWDSGAESSDIYKYRIARRMRKFYHETRQQQSRQQAGRAIAAEEAHEKTAHQIRKLNRRITGTDELDVLRHFYNTAYLSPREIQDIRRFASDISYRFGKFFLEGRNFHDYIQSAFEYAQRLRPLLLKVELGVSKEPQLPKFILKINDRVPSFLVWNHVDFLKNVSHVQNDSGEDALQVSKMVVKVCFYCALLSAFTNTLEHSCPETAIEITASDDGSCLEILNYAEPLPRGADTTISSKRGAGTAHTLSYYIKIYCGECYSGLEYDQMVALLKFEDTADSSNIFKTIIPIPNHSHICA